MSATITDSQLRDQKLARSSASDKKRDRGIKEVLSVAFEMPAGLGEATQIRLQSSPTLREFHDGLSRILVTVDGRQIQLSENFPEEKRLRVEPRVVHHP